MHESLADIYQIIWTKIHVFSIYMYIRHYCLDLVSFDLNMIYFNHDTIMVDTNWCFKSFNSIYRIISYAHFI